MKTEGQLRTFGLFRDEEDGNVVFAIAEPGEEEGKISIIYGYPSRTLAGLGILRKMASDTLQRGINHAAETWNVSEDEAKRRLLEGERIQSPDSF